MQAYTRRVVAFIVGALITDRKRMAIYDFGERRHVSMSGAVTADSVSVYDYEQRCYITGTSKSLYHYGNRAHITLQLNSSSFSGYDYDSKAHFTGTAHGANISLYDYERNTHFSYSM